MPTTIQATLEICIVLKEGDIQHIHVNRTHDDGEVNSTVDFSEDHSLGVMQLTHDDGWLDSSDGEFIDVWGNVLFRSNQQQEGGLMNWLNGFSGRVNFEVKEFHIAVPTITTASLSRNICTCSPTKLDDVGQDYSQNSLGIVQYNGNSVYYSCNQEGDYVYGGGSARRNDICLSLPVATADGVQFENVLMFNLTHPLTGSVIASFDNEGSDDS